MDYSHGKILRNTVEATEKYVINNGSPVIVNNQKTLEVLDWGFKIEYDKLIDLEDINMHMIEYYENNNIDFKNILELEIYEYETIMNELFEKFNLLDNDKYSRQVLFTDDCCISMIHLLYRNNNIYCFMHMRSSDCYNKLFADLYLVHRIIRNLQDKLNILNVIFNFAANSCHKIIF